VIKTFNESHTPARSDAPTMPVFHHGEYACRREGRWRKKSQYVPIKANMAVDRSSMRLNVHCPRDDLGSHKKMNRQEERDKRIKTDQVKALFTRLATRLCFLL